MPAQPNWIKIYERNRFWTSHNFGIEPFTHHPYTNTQSWQASSSHAIHKSL
jgi:hypothetical protein